MELETIAQANKSENALDDLHSENIDDSSMIENIQSPSTEPEEGEEIEKKDESLEFREELDYEEGERDSADEADVFSVAENKKEDNGEESPCKEDGELSEEEEDETNLRQEPKTVCRFFNKGQCTWGTNCRFLHPGVSDKGNYNMFAPNKGTGGHTVDEMTEKDHIEEPRELGRHIVPEPSPFESAWERGLRHAKEMMKRASKRKETDADFEEKRFNLSLGQAELDRENDYYTRPASPVYKPVDVDYPDPYERQAIRHFRGGQFENIEVRYNVEANYPRGGHVRSRRDKFEREVTERVPRRMRGPSPLGEHRPPKEKRYPRTKEWAGEKNHHMADDGSKQEAESWADPWARRRTPQDKKRGKLPRARRSYSSGSSSRSSRSSRSSSYSSYSRSSSHSSRSRSSSRSITPPIHPRQRAMASRGGRAVDRGVYKPRLPHSAPMNPNGKGMPLRRNEPTDDLKVDMFGRTIRREIPPSPPKGRPISRSPMRGRTRRMSQSSRSSISSGSSSTESSRSRSPVSRRKGTERIKMTQGTVSYGDSIKPKVDAKASAHKQIKLSLKKTALRSTRPAINIDEDSGESDVDSRVLKKRKAEPQTFTDEIPVSKRSRRQPSPNTMMAMIAKKPAGRREELLKQLQAVEDAIARKKGKPIQ